MLYIIRHGQTELNTKMMMQGRSDHPLNETGLAQAEEAAGRLAGMGVKIDKVYSSPLIRALQTAKLIAPEAELVIDRRLIEMDYGPYEGMDLLKPLPEVSLFFSDFVHNPAPAGMEALPHIIERFGAFLEDIRPQAEGKNILISTHAIAMKGGLEYLTPSSGGSYWATHIANCDVYAASFKDGEYGIPYKVWEL